MAVLDKSIKSQLSSVKESFGKNLIDLHTHSVYSDGGLTPNRLVCEAAEAGLKTIALADHDNITGLEVAILKGQELGVEVIPAVEITAYIDEENDLHILGYFIDWKDRELRKKLDFYQKQREEKAKKMVQSLNKFGYKINFHDLRGIAKGTIAQPHLAYLAINTKANEEQLLKDFGTVPDTGTFIQKYLATGGLAHESRVAATPQEALDLIHSAGGVAVLAHPCWNLVKKNGKRLSFDDSWVKKLVKMGLDGIEVYAHRNSEEDTRKCVEHYEKVADQYKLIKTGGSDFHGFGSAGKELGFKNFFLKVPDSVLRDLKARVKK